MKRLFFLLAALTLIWRGAAQTAPSIAWTSAPSTSPVGIGYFIEARGTDPDGDLYSVSVWRNGSPHAMENGGNGYDHVAGNPYTDTVANQDTEYTAEAIDAMGYSSGTIYNIVHIEPLSMTPPTSSDATINALTSFSPSISAPPSNGTGALMWCVDGPTPWMTGSWLAQAGNYIFHVGQLPDSNHKGNATDPIQGSMEVSGAYHLTVLKIAQPSVGISASGSTVQVGTTVNFTASGGAGTGAFVWSGISGNGVSASATFNSTGTYTVSVMRSGDGNYNDSNSASVVINVAQPYTLNVINGSGSGQYIPGTVVGLSAYGYSGYSFYRWVLLSGVGSFGNASAANTTFSIGVGGAIVGAAFTPTPPANLHLVTIAPSWAVINWSPSSIGGDTTYAVSINGGWASPTWDTSFFALGLSPNQSYSIAVYVVDSNGTWSSSPSVISVQTPPDTSAPNPPTRLRTGNVSATCFTLYWDDGGDNVGTTEYEVFRDGVSLGRTHAPYFDVSGLAPLTAYSFTVRAGDAAGFWSGQSNAVALTTNSPVVVGLHAAGYGTGVGQSFGVTSWEASQSQTTSAPGQGAAGWTTVHQYRTFAPGIDNRVRVTGSSFQRELRFDVPDGYTLFIDGNPYTNTATLDLGNANGSSADSADVAFTLMPNDGTAFIEAGYSINPQFAADDLIWALSLGRSPDGRPLGALALRRTNVTGASFSPEALSITGPELLGLVETFSDAEKGGSWGADRRFVYSAGNCWIWLDDHVSGQPRSYCEIKVYDPKASPTWDNVNKTYKFMNGASEVAPFQKYAISSSEQTNNDTITLTKNKGAPQELSWTLKKTVSGGTTTWLLTKAGQHVLRTVSTVSGNTTTEVATIEDGAGTVVQRYNRTYQAFPWGKKELVSEVNDPSGFNLTTTYSYGTTGPSYGKLLSVTKPDGSYVRYEYATDEASYGKLWRTYSPWLDVASTAASASASNARVVTQTYKPVFGYLADAPDSSVTSVPGSTIGKQIRNPDFSSTTFNGKRVRKETIQRYFGAGAGDYLTATRLTYHPAETTGNLANRLISETASDGTKTSTIYYQGFFTDSGDSNATVFKTDANTTLNTQWGEYKFNGFSSQVTDAVLVNSWDGQTVDPVYMVPKRSTVELTVAIDGKPCHSVHYVFTGASSGTPTFEFVGRDSITESTTLGVMTRNRTAHNGAQSQQVFTNGQLTTETANDGTTATYNYDGSELLTRKDTSALAASGNYAAIGALYTHYTYDAAGRKLTERTSSSASAGDPGPTITYHYDAAGRIDSATDASGLATSMTYDLVNHTTTSSLPGGATKIVTTYADGTPKSVTGTGVVAQYSAIVVNSDGTTTKTDYTLRGSDLSAPLSAPRWSKTTTDWLGRAVREEKPATSGSVAKTRVFNSKGELTKVRTLDGSAGSPLLADTVTEYDAYEKAYRTGMDLDSSSGLTIASATDRVSETDTLFEKDASGAWWLVALNKAYNQPLVAQPITTGVQKQRLNQFSLAGTNVQAETVTFDVNGNRTDAKTIVDRSSQSVTTDTDVPDSSVNTVKVTRAGLLVSEQNATNQITTYAYDSLRRLVCVSVPRIDGSTLAKDLPPRIGYYDGSAAVGSRYQKQWTKDTAGFQTTYAYSSTTGRLTSAQEPMQANHSAKYTYYDYTQRGELYRQWGAATYPVEYGFNDYGEKVSMTTYRGTDPSVWSQAVWPSATQTGDTTTWTFDPATGLLQRKTDATAHYVGYTYTKLGQLKTRTWARGVVTTYKYYGEDAGDLPTGEQKSIDYSDTPNTAPDLIYTYNRMGQTATVTDATGNRSFDYDPATTALQDEAFPAYLGGRILTRKYDTTGTGTLGRVTGFKLGVTGSLSGDDEVTYGYDGMGRFLSVNQGTAAFSYGYTPGSNLIGSVSEGTSGWTQTRQWLPDRDLLDTIQTQMGSSVKASFDYAYDEWGRRTSVVRGGTIYYGYVNGGQVTTWGYNDRSEVTSAQTFHGQSLTDLSYPIEGQNFSFGFDDIGNRLRSGVDDRITAYSSNALNQITARTTPGKVDVAGLAPTGSTVLANGQPVTRQGDYFHAVVDENNTSHAVNAAVTVTNSAPAANVTRMTFLAKASLTTAEQWQYDLDGNLTRDDQWSYTWDGENRLIAMETRGDLMSGGIVATADARRLEFTYDYLGRRVDKTVRSGWNGSIYATVLAETRFIYDGWNLVTEYAWNVSPAVLHRSYTWGLDITVSRTDAGGVGALLQIADQATGKTYLPAYDGNGNIVALNTASTTATAAIYEYGPFGESLRALTTDPAVADQPFRFSTKYYDAETGLYNYGHRYYDPTCGRFVGRDPIDEKGGLHLYAFCRNNPVNVWDVLGHKWHADDFSDIENLDHPDLDGWLPYGFGPASRSIPTYSIPTVNFSFGVGAGASATVAPTAVGVHGEIAVQAGVFVTSGPTQVGVSVGQVTSGGFSAGPGGILTQNTFAGTSSGSTPFSPAIGLAAGVSPFVWISNAGSASQLSNVNTTYNFNIGLPIVGPKAGFGISIGTGPGVWSLAVVPPLAPSGGGGIDLSMTPSTTLSSGSVVLSANPFPTQSFGVGSGFMNPNYQTTTMSISQAGMSNISTANVVSVTVNRQSGQVTVVTNGAPQEDDKKDDDNGGGDGGATIPDVPRFDDTSAAR